jgi:hypothetical protein
MVGAGLSGGLLLAACSGSVSVSGGTKEVAQSEVESTVASQLAAQTNQPIPKVSCPGALQAKVGATIDCTLTPQGATASLPVHVVVDSVDSNGIAHYTAQAGQFAGAGDKTAFCADNATLDKATSVAQQPSDLVPILKTNQSVIDDFQAKAPSEIVNDAGTLVQAAKNAITSGDASAFASAAVQTAGKNVDGFCGQNADGSPATSTTSTSTGA